MRDMKIIAAIIAASAITFDSGKLSLIDLLLTLLADYLLAVPSETNGNHEQETAWILTGYRGTFGT